MATQHGVPGPGAQHGTAARRDEGGGTIAMGTGSAEPTSAQCVPHHAPLPRPQLSPEVREGPAGLPGAAAPGGAPLPGRRAQLHGDGKPHAPATVGGARQCGVRGDALRARQPCRGCPGKTGSEGTVRRARHGLCDQGGCQRKRAQKSRVTKPDGCLDMPYKRLPVKCLSARGTDGVARSRGLPSLPDVWTCHIKGCLSSA